jgi:hypothetical protein
MTVKELIEKLSKLAPDLECITLDSDGCWCRIVDAWCESDPSTSNIKDFAYIETFGPVELN